MTKPWSLPLNLILKPFRCFCNKDEEKPQDLQKPEQKVCFFDPCKPPAHKEKLKSVGPWGGNKGGEWSFNEDGSGVMKQIVVVHGDGIDSLVFKYKVDGKLKSSPRAGGPGGLHTDKIDFDWTQEYLTCINGYYGSMWWGGPIVVRSLTFITNLTTYGPFGCEEGSYFELPSQGGKIVGFFGTCGQFVDSIGIYTKLTKK